jgi:MOSC domain-containing protein YiiM
MINVEKIYYKDNESNQINAEKVKLITGYGIDGDVHGGKAGRHVSIMFKQTRSKMNSIPVKGLCTSRFKENITLSEIAEIKVGDTLVIEKCEIKITQIGKKCFSECELFENKISCYLNEVIFGEILVSGEIKIGDEIIIKENKF